MRPFSKVISVPAGGVWPTTEGGDPLPWFRWVALENRAVAGSGNDLWVAVDSIPNAGDSSSALMIVTAGTQQIRNLAGERDEEGDAQAAHRLRILNVGAVAITAYLELDTEPITWMVNSVSPAATSEPPNEVLDTNESSTPLAANATFNGATHDTGNNAGTAGVGWSKFRALAFADQAGTLNIQQSRDGVTWRTTTSVAVTANSAVELESLVTRRFVRMQYVNGAAAQATFEADSALVSI